MQYNEIKYFKNFSSTIVLGIFIGFIATIFYDLYSVMLYLNFNMYDPIDWHLLGRWIGHLLVGDFVFVNIPKLSIVQHEIALGWMTHYMIGILDAIIFAFILKYLMKKSYPGLSVFSISVLFGWFLIIFPFLVLEPAMGAGFFAVLSPNPDFTRWLTFSFHSVFGLGLFIGYRICQFFSIRFLNT